MLVIMIAFQQKWMMMLEDTNQAVPGCLQLLSFLKNVDDSKGRREMTEFLILSMAGTTARF